MKKNIISQMLASVGLMGLQGSVDGKQREPRKNSQGIIDIEELFYLPKGVKRIKRG